MTLFRNTVLERSDCLPFLNRMIGNTSDFDASNSVHGIYYLKLKNTVSETQNGMFSFESYCWILDSK